MLSFPVAPTSIITSDNPRSPGQRRVLASFNADAPLKPIPAGRTLSELLLGRRRAVPWHKVDTLPTVDLVLVLVLVLVCRAAV
jgi:hypothetical protein